MNAVPQALEVNARYRSPREPHVLKNFDLLSTAPAAVERLRELILTLGIRGKLVSQDLREESAATLLEQVCRIRARLRAEHKARLPDVSCQVTSLEGPFTLPAGWQWVQLGSLLQKIGAGSTPLGGKEVYVASGVKFLRSQNVWNTGLRLDGVVYINPETHARMAGTAVQASDLLFNLTGASIGRCAEVPPTFDEANVSQHVTILRPVLPALTPYLHKVLISRHVQQIVMDVQVGVSREGLSIAKLKTFLVPVPPLKEQLRIVGRLDELMRLCDALEVKGRLEVEQHARLLSTLLGTLTDSRSPDELAENWQRVAAHFDLLLDRPGAVDALEQLILQLGIGGILSAQAKNVQNPHSWPVRKLAEIGKWAVESGFPHDAQGHKGLEIPLPR